MSTRIEIANVTLTTEPFSCSMERNPPSRTVVMTVLLFLFANPRNRNIPSNPITINVIDFFYVDMASSFYRVESMPCENKNSFINGIFIPFMFYYVS